MSTFFVVNKKNSLKFLLSTLLSALGMWVIAGVYHNLILPTLSEELKPHHEGLGIGLIAYFILALLITYVYQRFHRSSESILSGLEVGILVGVIWVFPHGLVMAGIHDTSIVYEIKNALYHILEQGAGGIIVYLVCRKSTPS